MNILLAMIPAFFWGTTYAVTQFTLPDWPPLLLGAIRALPAGLILLAIQPMWPHKKEWQPLALLGAINIAVFFTLIFIMAKTLPSALSGVGMVALPVFAMLFQLIFFAKLPNWRQVLAGAILVTAAWLLFDPSHLSLNPLGLLALLGAIGCILVGSVMTQKLAIRMHWWKVLTWQLILGGLLLTLVFIGHSLFNQQDYSHLIYQYSWRNLFGMIWIVILNTALGYAMYVWLVQRMSIVDFTFGGVANPIAGILSGLLLMAESYSLYQYSLMALMILASLLPQLLIKLKQLFRP